MRQLKLETEANWFTLDEFNESKLYAGLVKHDDGTVSVCVLTRDMYREGNWKMLKLSPGDTTRANGYSPGSSMELTMRRFAFALGGSIYEFDTAHEFFTWAAEVTA